MKSDRVTGKRLFWLQFWKFEASADGFLAGGVSRHCRASRDGRQGAQAAFWSLSFHKTTWAQSWGIDPDDLH